MPHVFRDITLKPKQKQILLTFSSFYFLATGTYLTGILGFFYHGLRIQLRKAKGSIKFAVGIPVSAR